MLCCLGDLLDDIVIWPSGPVAEGSDTPSVISRRRGGSASNVACFASAGASLPTRFVGCVGADRAGESLAAELRAAGVDPCLDTTGSRTGTIVVLVAPDGERTMFTDRAAATELTRLPAHALDDVTWLHVPFYSFQVEPLSVAATEAVESARRLGIPVSVDASSVSLLEAFGVSAAIEQIGPVDVLFANEAEAALLADRWPAALTVVKRGPRSALLRRPGHDVVEVPVPLGVPGGVVIDTTGAGDAFAAAFIAATMTGATPQAAALAGHLLAARVLRSPGATLAP